MAIVRTDDKYYKSIADKLRSYGYTDTATPEQMTSFIEHVVDNERIAANQAGEKAQYDRFWDAFQQNGERTAYNSAFGCQWTPEIWKPKYPIRPTNIYMMFFSNTSEHLIIPDFVEFCEENNIVFDLSNASGTGTYALAALHTNHFGILDFSCKDTSKTISIPHLFYSHGYEGGVKIIDEFISSERTIYFQNTFQNATYLEELNMSGVIATNDFNVQWCTKLTRKSLLSIIEALQNKTTDTSGTTWLVTLGATNIAKLSNDELAMIEAKGWTYQ